jgi:hypothetical protein
LWSQYVRSFYRAKQTRKRKLPSTIQYRMSSTAGGHNEGELVHHLSVSDPANRGWQIKKIDLSSGKADPFISVIKTPEETDVYGNVIYEFKKTNWPISGNSSLILKNPSDNIELKIWVSRDQDTNDPSPFIVKPKLETD